MTKMTIPYDILFFLKIPLAASNNHNKNAF